MQSPAQNTARSWFCCPWGARGRPDSSGKQNQPFSLQQSSIWHRPWEALVRDSSLAFVQGLPLATLSVWFLPLALWSSASLGGSRGSSRGLWEAHRSTSARPLPAERSSTSGLPRLTAKPACWHLCFLLTSFTPDLARSASSAAAS